MNPGNAFFEPDPTDTNEMSEGYPDRFSRVGPDGYEMFNENNGEDFGISYRSPAESLEEYIGDNRNEKNHQRFGGHPHRQNTSHRRQSDSFGQMNRERINRERTERQGSGSGKTQSSQDNQFLVDERSMSDGSRGFSHSGYEDQDFFRPERNHLLSNTGWNESRRSTEGLGDQWRGQQDVNRRYGQQYGNEGYNTMHPTERSNGSQSNENLHRGKGPKNYQRSDEKIREEVCELLTEHHAVDASEIEVEVLHGEVTLKGTVADRQQKKTAERVIENVRGVNDVKNQLRVNSNNAPNSSNSSTESTAPSSAPHSSSSQAGATGTQSSSGSSSSSSADTKRRGSNSVS